MYVSISTHIYIYTGWPGHAPRGAPPQEVPRRVRGHPDLHHLRIEVEMKEWILYNVNMDTGTS